MQQATSADQIPVGAVIYWLNGMQEVEKAKVVVARNQVTDQPFKAVKRYGIMIPLEKMFGISSDIEFTVKEVRS
jgi:hypothetical protein